MTERERGIAAKTEWKEYERQQCLADWRQDFSIGLAASFTIDALVPFLGVNLLELGLRPKFHIAPYNQLFQVCLNPAGAFPKDAWPLNTIAVFWRMEDILAPEMESEVLGKAGAIDAALGKIEELAAAVIELHSHFPGILVVSNPPFPQSSQFHLHDLLNPLTGGRFHRRIMEHWCGLLQNYDSIHILDLDGLQAEYGARNVWDLRKWYLYKQPYVDTFLMQVAYILRRIIQAKLMPPKKCLVLDCDNTLWGGVVGEDGPDGLDLGDEFPGSGFRDFQKLLFKWHNQGIFLALSSKNNETDVWEVFDRHDAMVLKREHLAAWRINWRPKAENIRDIGAELNIALDSIVFIDDNPFEIEQVKSALPEVTCFLLPNEVAFIADAVTKAHFFDRLIITEEDRRRTKMIVQERNRKILKSQISEGDFLASLDLRVEAFQAEAAHISRITQLINRTNQFNLTTIRRTQEEVQKLMEDLQYRLYAARIEDRFGDYGLSGVAIVRKEGTVWLLDTFLLSCRVLGRGVETALLAFLAQNAHQEGAKLIAAQFIPSAKNAPVAEFLPNQGFRKTEDGNWVIEPGNILLPPTHITLNLSCRAPRTCEMPAD